MKQLRIKQFYSNIFYTTRERHKESNKFKKNAAQKRRGVGVQPLPWVRPWTIGKTKEPNSRALVQEYCALRYWTTDAQVISKVKFKYLTRVYVDKSIWSPQIGFNFPLKHSEHETSVHRAHNVLFQSAVKYLYFVFLCILNGQKGRTSRERAKPGLQVHGPPLWTGSMDPLFFIPKKK